MSGRRGVQFKSISGTLAPKTRSARLIGGTRQSKRSHCAPKPAARQSHRCVVPFLLRVNHTWDMRPVSVVAQLLLAPPRPSTPDADLLTRKINTLARNLHARTFATVQREISDAVQLKWLTPWNTSHISGPIELICMRWCQTENALSKGTKAWHWLIWTNVLEHHG